MKYVSILFILACTLCSCSSDHSTDGSLNNKIDCSDNSITSTPVDYELLCDGRNHFFLQSSETKTKLLSMGIESCEEEHDEIIAKISENSGSTIIVGDDYLIVNGDVYCDDTEDCLEACKAAESRQ